MSCLADESCSFIVGMALPLPTFWLYKKGVQILIYWRMFSIGQVCWAVRWELLQSAFAIDLVTYVCKLLYITTSLLQ